MTYLVDSHCHLADLNYAERSVEQVLARAYSCKVTHFMSIACTLKDAQKNFALADKYSNIYLACGVHPLNLEDDPDWKEDDLEKILNHNKVLALGETGLDYHYMPETAKLQKESFARQIELAVA